MNKDIHFEERLQLDDINDTIGKIKNEIQNVIIGQNKMIDLLLTAILANGHVLLEGVPGIAKTLTAKLIAKVMKIKFSRIQFTPDLMPSDLIGTTIFNNKKSEFEFKPGPLFSNLVLIDEINRAPAKTQAALFEVMEERQITVNRTTYKLSEPFIVIATQNPIEYEGTYRLPEAQLDRFLFKIKLFYPTLEEEIKILSDADNRKEKSKLEDIKTVITAKTVSEFQKKVKSVKIDKELLEYIGKIVDSTRNNSSLYLGASPRASLSIMDGSKAYAVLNGRDFTTPEDIQAVTYSAMRHRIILTPEKEMEGGSTEDIISDILENIEVPR